MTDMKTITDREGTRLLGNTWNIARRIQSAALQEGRLCCLAFLN